MQAALFQSFGKSFGICDHLGLILILEGIHLHGGDEQSQQRSQMVIAGGSGKSPPVDGFPKFPVHVVIRIKIGGHHTALGTEKGFVGRTGHQVGALGKRLLKAGTYQTQYMGHVVHDDGGKSHLVNELADGRHRFLMQDHAFSQNDQFRPVPLQ